MTKWLLGTDLASAGHLQWDSPQWVILTACFVAFVAFFAATLGERDLRQRASELLFWGVSLALLVVALCEPTWVVEEGRTINGRDIVLVDSSASMGILEDGVSRSAAVTPIMEHLASSLGPEHEVFHFGGTLVPGAPQAFNLPGTDLEGAIAALNDRLAGEPISSLTVVTDGLDRGLLRSRYNEDKQAAPPKLPGPLTVFQVGQTRSVIDLAVRKLNTGGFAFIRSPFTITAQITGLGFHSKEVTVSLERDGAPVTDQTITLDKDGNADVVFTVRADEAGRFAYSVRVPQYEGDAVLSNNVQSVVVRVVRDRIRVLQVTGSPGWDVKFLRRFLKGDPSVDLVSFFILRTHEDFSTPYRTDELSLIQFPYERLFAEELSTFDVVIFQNFDYKPYFTRNGFQLLANIARYVEEGGAFVMVGGDRSFSLAGYEDTPLASILPVKLTNNSEPSLTPFSPVLTAEGGRHPLTRLVSDSAENSAWWERLVPVDGTNTILGPTKDATVLLSHPTLTTSNNTPMPILAVREVKKGRSMALTIDGSWRWSLSEAAQGHGNQAYLRFWKNAIRWLMRDDSTARVIAATSHENVTLGESNHLVVKAKSISFAALEGAQVELTITGPDGDETITGTTNSDGEWAEEFEPKQVGTHRMKAVVKSNGAVVGIAESVFAVSTRDPEVDEIAPDVVFLSKLTQSVGGRLHLQGTLGAVLRDESAGRMVPDEQRTSLAQAPILGFLILFFAGIAFGIRRRAGLR